jgi:hypothetical protein
MVQPSGEEVLPLAVKEINIGDVNEVSVVVLLCSLARPLLAASWPSLTRSPRQDDHERFEAVTRVRSWRN